MAEKIQYEQNNVITTDPGIDTREYELNQNPNETVYEEQQLAAIAVNGSHNRNHWFLKK